MEGESFTIPNVNISPGPQHHDRGKSNSVAGRGPTQDDLTNLNWVAGIPVPMNTSVSPPEGARARRLFFGPNCKNLLGQYQNETNAPPISPVLSVPVRTKSLKTPLPTYKIILKDSKPESANFTSSSNNNQSSPEKRDSVILANIVSSSNDELIRPELAPLYEKTVADDEVCVVIDKEVEKEEPIRDVAATKDMSATEEKEEEEDGDEVVVYHDKPNCSYTCLIGMALKASTGCLPVNAIYQYVEKEFPYFLTAPDGWKNSVRHNLSLNPIFRKVNRDGWTGKKGYLWEVCPDKQDLVDKEILRFLHSTGKKLGKFTAPVKASAAKYKQRAKKRLGLPIICSRCTRILSPTPHESSTSSDDNGTHMVMNEEIKKYSTEIQEEINTSEICVQPKVTVTDPAFDIDESPSKYVGMKPPSGDPKEIAKELFGIGSSPENPNAFYPPLSYGGAFFPLYPQLGQFGIPFENCDKLLSNSSSSSSANSPHNPMGPSWFFPQFPQYARPVPIQYIYGSQYPHLYGFSPPGFGPNVAQHNNENMVMEPPVSVKVLSSSDQVEKEELASTNEKHHFSSQNGISAKTGKHQKDSGSFSEVTNLSSPLKKMKVIDDGSRIERVGDESISAYFADVSANSTCSDGEAEEDEDLPSIMSIFNQQRRKERSFPLAELCHISTQEKENLEEMAGTTDLSALLIDGFESITDNSIKEAVSYTDCNKPSTNLPCSEKCGPVSSVDMHDIDIRAVSTQQDSYYLPSLDSLLHMGDDTIVTLKAAMNLEIQGVVEVATEESNREIAAEPGVAISSDSVNEIEIN